MIDLQTFYYLASIVGLGIVGLWSLFMWVSKQFKDAISLVLSKMERIEDAIMAKIEYHEKHDDNRFSQVANDIWAIKIRNASIDGRKNVEVDAKV